MRKPPRSLAKSVVRAEAEGLSRRSACRISSTISKRWRPAASTARPSRSSPGRRWRSILSDARGGAGAYRLRPRHRRSRQGGAGCSASPCSRRRMPTPAARSAISPARLAAQGPGRPRRDQRTCRACRLRLDQAGLLHQPDVLRRARRRRRAAASSTSRRAPPPSSTSARRPRKAETSRKAGRWTPRASRPPIPPRR